MFMLKSALKAGGVQLPEHEMRSIAKKFDYGGTFAWLRFCEALENGTLPAAEFHPRPPSRPGGDETFHFSKGGLVGKNMSRGSVSSKFLDARASPSVPTNDDAAVTPLHTACQFGHIEVGAAEFEPATPGLRVTL